MFTSVMLSAENVAEETTHVGCVDRVINVRICVRMTKLSVDDQDVVSSRH